MNTFKQIICSFAIMNVCWKNAYKENISFNIDKYMAFSTVNFFPSVEPTFAAGFRGFNRLAINASSSGFGIPVLLDANAFNQRGVRGCLITI